MKEIDFLPEWYKSGRRRQVSYRTQYIALGGMFAVMIVWNFVAMYSISRAKAQSSQMAIKQVEAESRTAKLSDLKEEVKELQEKAEYIEEIDSKIDVASVLAELSFLINEKIVLSKVEFVSEKFKDRQRSNSSSRSGAVVRAVKRRLSDDRNLPLGDVRFKITLSGVAADAGDVAALICSLEESPYFFQVVPSFSKTIEIKAEDNYSSGSWGRGEENVQVSEFEISCYLANYIEQ